ncbi:unnamed protein product [Spirodela intermedia]|uniref:Uncharacterized protein n=1 Tax=Spirodela intermedia TaxID=51605 RepID=A0A7I8KAG6_SPIIN|nr:unnamed protein product [Spirodela intermedia]
MYEVESTITSFKASIVMSSSTSIIISLISNVFTIFLLFLNFKKTEFWCRDGDASAMHRNPEHSGGSSCSVHGLEAFGRVVVQCPRPRRLSLDKDNVGNL